MPNRSWTTEALVLCLAECFSDNKNVTLLVPQQEACSLITATIYGGARSKLRGLVAMYQTGQVWLYSNPVKNTHKLVDFTVQAHRLALRDNLVRMWCAAVCNEIAIKTKGTVDWKLVNAFLDGLCVSTPQACKPALLRFLWRILTHAGLAPALTACGQCGVPFTESPAAQSVFYNASDDSFCCKTCMQHDRTFALSGEAFHYLQAITYYPPAYSRNFALSAHAYGELKRCLFFLCKKMVGGNLNSIQTSRGIL